MDVIDRANDHADYLLQVALANRPTAAGPSAEWCDDCGNPIPEARREAVPGCETCVSCQEIREHLARI
ncbi:TraR/DksA family transcriptional regulator [Pseudomonas sp. C9-3]|uniref:TraR/DksA family transcriptional regulator n=1 Tax=Pseudomonas sp. C9-3 TaxID=3078264 RepID=UPI0028ECE349|nr:TraR/DksA family transcriptional regulator [Pseudomonas sp. C9-3]